MISAQEPPELAPIVARPSGSRVSFTLYFDSTSGSTSCSTNSAYLPDIVSYSRPRSLPWASPPPLPMNTPIIAGRRCCAIRSSSSVGHACSTPSAPPRNAPPCPAPYRFAPYPPPPRHTPPHPSSVQPH